MTDSTRTAQANVEQARADLGETIDALKRKLSLGELISEVQSQLGGSGAVSTMMNNLSRQAQSNPMALALVGAGIAWLMIGNGRPMNGGHASPHAGSTAFPSTTSMSASAADSASSARDAAGRLAEGASSAASRVSDALSSAGNAVSETSNAVASGMSSAADGSSQALGAASKAAADAPQHLQKVGEDLVERYPLVVGAAAVALGAAIGSALPRTDFEDRQMGEASDKAKQVMSARGEEIVDQAEVVASKAGEAAAREADKQGLVPGEGADEPTVVERVEKVGRETAQAARDEVRRQTGPSSSTTGRQKQP
ncbi:MAG: DUF3618 domain-containing protein [Hyphomicrobiaceae bacterium]